MTEIFPLVGSAAHEVATPWQIQELTYAIEACAPLSASDIIHTAVLNASDVRLSLIARTKPTDPPVTNYCLQISQKGSGDMVRASLQDGVLTTQRTHQAASKAIGTIASHLLQEEDDQAGVRMLRFMATSAPGTYSISALEESALSQIAQVFGTPRLEMVRTVKLRDGQVVRVEHSQSNNEDPLKPATVDDYMLVVSGQSVVAPRQECAITIYDGFLPGVSVYGSGNPPTLKALVNPPAVDYCEVGAGVAYQHIPTSFALAATEILPQIGNYVQPHDVSGLL
jgi:hypothetical protein